MKQPSRMIVASALLATLTSACGADGARGPTIDQPATDAPDSVGQDDLGGFGAPAAAPGEFDLPDTMVMAGTVRADARGCWRLEGSDDGALLVLPPGFELGASGEQLLTESGETLPSGTPVEATGALIGVDALPGGPDGRWGAYIGFCDPDTALVAVAEHLEVDRFDADSFDDADFVELLAASTFDTPWPCGYGFAVSDGEQRVGLYITPTTAEPPTAGPVLLPDERFVATVVFGRHLFVDHCDDVTKWFEPVSQRLAEWPVTAGRFDYQPGEDTGSCTSGARVTTTLTDAVATTPLGEQPLPTLELVNDAFGCFAG